MNVIQINFWLKMSMLNDSQSGLGLESYGSSYRQHSGLWLKLQLWSKIVVTQLQNEFLVNSIWSDLDPLRGRKKKLHDMKNPVRYLFGIVLCPPIGHKMIPTPYLFKELISVLCSFYCLELNYCPCSLLYLFLYA